MDTLALPAEIAFSGPYDLCPTSNGNWPLEKEDSQGIYLFTVEVLSQYRILYVGVADHVANRLREHIASYLSGQCWLYESADLKEGRHKTAWEPTAQSEKSLAKLPHLQRAISETLPLLRIFVCRTSLSKTDLYRIESAIISSLREDTLANDFLENHRLSITYRKEKQSIRVAASAQLFAMPPNLQV